MKIISLFMFFIFLAIPAMAEMPSTNNPKILKIKWQRLVIKGETCPRCGATEKEMEKAFQTLEQSLAPLGIKVALEKQELDPGEFKKDPLQSNRIWIEGRSLEEWLGLKVGQNPCCSTCGDAECRTVEMSGQVYETIPADLVIKASIMAASKLLGSPPSDLCCQKNAEINKNPQACCPK